MASEIKRAVVCVFCGSVSGNDPAHLEVARALAHEFHKHNIQLVYGGGTSGLMGEIARTLVRLSGPESVHGVIPRALIRIEPGYDNAQKAQEQEHKTMSHGKDAERVLNDPISKAALLQESEYGVTTITADMHTRKRLMATKVMEGGPGSGFVTLAGGFGTIEEVMEMTTWNQLGIHRRPIILMNVNGYWDGLLAWVKNAVEKGYIGPANSQILVEAKEVKEVWGKLLGYNSSCGQMQLNWGDE
ncbi:LOG family protein [Aspergillus ruber CBS 135680]|uniref:Lysine decarboxylase-like protein n=1 Tax=Aspergillus ruber (strain CBS 135680) TaxID=1388766 RepID=A0A017SJU4_ASPRC|nr:lysine decarboxylase-like protein [Aspergillus ruber CBS 135680]EYE97238.1 lysine decarboxylase-like protein [Aspergillus ruber CBS 135680]